jgi:ubiquinone/menaquinone biosynthesis methyltransferase
VAESAGGHNAAQFDAARDDVFARIAHRYDVLCDIFSLRAHRLWKDRMARRIAAEPGVCVLDVAAGTGDIPLRLLRHLDRQPPPARQRKIFVTDLCPEMLAIARSKPGARDSRLAHAVMDAHDLRDVADSSVDTYSISFGMKILDRKRVIAEAMRVLKPGGRFFCLEAARIPLGIVHAAYLKYMDLCLPLIARIATGGDAGAYDYFLRGIHGFPDQPSFARELERHGFGAVGYENLTFGIVALHWGVKR